MSTQLQTSRAYRRRLIWPLVLAATVIFSGCAQMTGGKPSATGVPSPADNLAAVRAAELSELNQTLISCSGVGKLTVKREGRVFLNDRVAWVGAAPDKLSLVVFVSGFPALRFASDGSWFYLIEPGESKPRFERMRASDSALARIIGIQITFEEIVSLLRGRVPLADFSTARLTPGTVDRGDELTLKKWWGAQEKIWLETGGSRPLRMERYERSGSQRYRVVFNESMRIDGYRVPRRLGIFAGAETEFSLVIDRYLPNPEVSPEMFVLTPIQ